MGMVLPETSKCAPTSLGGGCPIFKDVFFSPTLGMPARLCLGEAVVDTLVGVMESHCLFNLHFSAGQRPREFFPSTGFPFCLTSFPECLFKLFAHFYCIGSAGFPFHLLMCECYLHILYMRPPADI